MSIVQNIQHTPHIIVNTIIPWSVHHRHTVILNKEFDGHVYLKTTEGLFYLGDSSGLKAPIMLGNILQYRKKRIDIRSVTEIASIILRRFQVAGEIPDVQSSENEKIIRSVVYSLAKKHECIDAWLHMEESRLKELLSHYDLANIQLVYPMVKSKESAWQDVRTSYQSIRCIHVPEEPFLWLSSILKKA